jgi:hypothetical protein
MPNPKKYTLEKGITNSRDHLCGSNMEIIVQEIQISRLEPQRWSLELVISLWNVSSTGDS